MTDKENRKTSFVVVAPPIPSQPTLPLCYCNNAFYGPTPHISHCCFINPYNFRGCNCRPSSELPYLSHLSPALPGCCSLYPGSHTASNSLSYAGLGFLVLVCTGVLTHCMGLKIVMVYPHVLCMARWFISLVTTTAFSPLVRSPPRYTATDFLRIISYYYCIIYYLVMLHSHQSVLLSIFICCTPINLQIISYYCCITYHLVMQHSHQSVLYIILLCCTPINLYHIIS